MVTSKNIDISTATPELNDLVSRATERQEIITLTAKDEKSAVLLSLEAFQYLVGLQEYRQRELMPSSEFEQQFHKSLIEAGYDSRDKVIDLVRSVKAEMYEERQHP